jgi:hypothetical protein
MCTFFSGLMDPRCSIHKLSFFRMIGMSLLCCALFKHWVPTPPKPPLMTDKENDEASTYRVRNPSTCKCGYRAELVNPPTRLDYTSFFRCPIPFFIGNTI